MTTATGDLHAARHRRLSLRAEMGRFEEALAAPTVGREPAWTVDAGAAIARLHGCMQTHLSETEGPHGFHHDIVTAAPRLVHQVEVSVREHGLITATIHDLQLALDSPPTAASTASIREVGTDLLVLLARHRQRGADMIYEAYQTDLGGGD